MRGGLDDALEKLARRDELRRRAKGEAPGTPPAVTELVEAIAGVVARNPKLGVTVGVEGAGDPLLLHFYFADGQVQVNADNAIAQNPPGARHADVAVEIGDPIDEPYQPPAPPEPRRGSEDQDRYRFEYADPAPYNDTATAERRYGTFDPPSDPRYAAPGREPSAPAGPPPGPADRDLGEDSRDLGARMRNLGMASSRENAPPPQYPPHPFAATPPPPVPPQSSAAHGPGPSGPIPPQSAGQQATRRIQPEHHRVPAEPSAAERIVPQQHQHPNGQHPNGQHPNGQHSGQHQAAQGRPPVRGGMPAPLPQPIPLQVERPEETEIAARRLAALLRDDPSLLEQQPRAE